MKPLSGESIPSSFLERLITRVKPHLRTIRSIFVLVIMGLTSWYMGQQVYLAYDKLQDRPLTIRYDFLALALLLDMAGMMLISGPFGMALFDRERLAPTTHKLTWNVTAQAYLISQIGKYVPGKAIVIVVRYMVLGRLGFSLGVVVLATFFETFCSLSAAALLSFLLWSLPISVMGQSALAELPWAWPISLLFFLGLVSFILPPVLAIAPRLLAKIIPTARHHAENPIGWKTIGWSFVPALLGWSMLGASFAAVVQSVYPKNLSLTEVPTLGAVFTLSYVAGFLSMVPGHFGIREFIMDVVLRPLLDGDQLVVVSATLLSRLVTLIGEIVLALIFYALYRVTTAHIAPPNHKTTAPLEGESLDG